MLERIHRFALEIGSSAEFDCHYERGAAADAASIHELRRAFAGVGIEMPVALHDLYATCDGLTMRWMSKRTTHPDYLTAGNASLPPLATLLASIRHAPREPALFDYISDQAQVELRLDGGHPQLWYHQDEPELDAPLRLDIGAYLEVLDLSRGLHPWPELFIDTLALPSAVLRDKFFVDMSRLFGGVDTSVFDSRSRR
jgi:hypothetical protein